MAFNKQVYDNEYKRQHLDQILFTVPKGKKDLIKQLASTKGISVTRLIIDALETMYQIDLSK